MRDSMSSCAIALFGSAGSASRGGRNSSEAASEGEQGRILGLVTSLAGSLVLGAVGYGKRRGELC